MKILLGVAHGVIVITSTAWTTGAMAATCTYAVSTPGPEMSAIGGNILISILTGSDCAWSVTGVPTWLSVSGKSQGTGSALVKLEAAPNSGGPRSAVITVGGVAVPVRQFDLSACGGAGFCAVRTLPHVAVGGEWTTSLFAVSSETHAGYLSVAFYADNGWGQITLDTSVTAQAVFRRAAANATYYEAAVPMGYAYSGFVIPFDATAFAPTGAPLYTGFAIANLNPMGAAHVVCTARDQSGAVIPNALTIPTLNPMGHYADYLFPALTGKRGTLECYADSLVSAIALRFIGTDAFSTLPVIILDPGLD